MGEKRGWAAPKGRGGRGAEEAAPSPGLALAPPPSASAVFRLDRVVPSDPGGIRRALAQLGAAPRPAPPGPAPLPKGGSVSPAPGLPPCPPPMPLPPYEPRNNGAALSAAPEVLRPGGALRDVGGFLAKRRERPRKEEPLGFGDPPTEVRSRTGAPEGIGPHLWGRLQSGAARKAFSSAEAWMEPLGGAFEDVGGTEMSQSDSGVELSGDSGPSSAACSQRSSPDGGMKMSALD